MKKYFSICVLIAVSFLYSCSMTDLFKLSSLPGLQKELKAQNITSSIKYENSTSSNSRRTLEIIIENSAVVDINDRKSCDSAVFIAVNYMWDDLMQLDTSINYIVYTFSQDNNSYSVELPRDETYFIRAHAFMDQEKLDSCAVYINKAIALDPTKVMYYDALALTQIRMEKFNEALQNMEKANSMGEAEGGRFRTIGYCFIELKEYEKAIGHLDIAIEIDDKDWDAYADRGLARYYLEQYTPALHDLEVAIMNRPDISKWKRRKADCYIELNKLDSARVILDAILSAEPENVRTIFSMGKLRMKENNMTAACEYFDRAAALKDKDAQKMIDKHCKQNP